MTSLHQVGQVNLADARLNVDWTEDFKTPDQVTTRLTVKGTMTEGGARRAATSTCRAFSAARCR